MTLQILINNKSGRQFILCHETGERVQVKYPEDIKGIMPSGTFKKKESFSEMKELNKFCKDIKTISKGMAPKATPSCHKFFAKE